MAKRHARHFWANVRKTDGCWLWQGTTNEHGYGRFTVPRQGQVFAHRYAFEDYFWPLQPGECVLHDCDNPRCVRPSHLTPGDRDDNNKDMAAKRRGRQAIGVALAQFVLHIMGDMTTRELSTQTGVSHMTACRARKASGLPRASRWGLKRKVSP